MRFHVVVDGFIDADDIDDAMAVIAAHFSEIPDGGDSRFLPDSTLSVKPA